MEGRRRLIKIIVGAFLTIYGILYLVPYAMSVDSYKTQLSKVLEQATGLNIVIKGDTNLQLVPLPKVTFNNIYAVTPEEKDPQMHIHKISARVSIISLFSGTPAIATLTLTQPELNWAVFGNIRERISKLQKTAAGTLPSNISISEGVLYFGQLKTKDTLQISHISTDMDIGEDSFDLSGSFNYNDYVLSYTASVKRNADAMISISGDQLTMTFKGKETAGPNGTRLLQGTIDGETPNIAAVIHRYLSSNPDQKFNLKDGEAFSIKSNLSLSNQLSEFTKIAFSSKSIKGTGDISVLLDRGIPEFDVSIIIDKINADTLLKSFSQTETKDDAVSAKSLLADEHHKMNLYTKLGSLLHDFATSASMLCDITINTVTYKGQDIQKLTLNADLFNADLAINELTAKIPGNGFVEIYGSVNHKEIRPRFTGEINVQGQSLRDVINWLGIDLGKMPEKSYGSFRMGSDITIMPNKINFSEMELSFDKAQMSGSIFVRVSENLPKINAVARFSNFDLDYYGISKRIKDIAGLYYFGDSTKKETMDFSWLRRFKSSLSLDLSFEQTNFLGENYQQVGGDFILLPGSVRFEDVSIVSPRLNGIGNVKLDIAGLRPRITAGINASFIDTTLFAKESNIAKKTTPSKEFWSSEPFNFYGLDRFDGTIGFKASYIQTPESLYQDVDIQLKGEEDVINLDHLTAKKAQTLPDGTIYLTNITVKGMLNVDPTITPTFAFSYGIENGLLETTIAPFLSLDGLQGFYSVGGSFTVKGKSLKEAMASMIGNGTFASVNVVVPNFSLNTIVEKEKDVVTLIQLDDLSKEASRNGNTQFVTISGGFKMVDGLMDVPQLILATDRFNGALAGKLNLQGMLLNTAGKFVFIPNDDNKTITLGFNAKGPANALERSFIMDELAIKKGLSTSAASSALVPSATQGPTTRSPNTLLPSSTPATPTTVPTQAPETPTLPPSSTTTPQPITAAPTSSPAITQQGTKP